MGAWKKSGAGLFIPMYSIRHVRTATSVGRHGYPMGPWGFGVDDGILEVANHAACHLNHCSAAHNQRLANNTSPRQADFN
jgi:hypothetical protein